MWLPLELKLYEIEPDPFTEFVFSMGFKGEVRVNKYPKMYELTHKLSFFTRYKYVGLICEVVEEHADCFIDIYLAAVLETNACIQANTTFFKTYPSGFCSWTKAKCSCRMEVWCAWRWNSATAKQQILIHNKNQEKNITEQPCRELVDGKLFLFYTCLVALSFFPSLTSL